MMLQQKVVSLGPILICARSQQSTSLPRPLGHSMRSCFIGSVRNQASSSWCSRSTAQNNAIKGLQKGSRSLSCAAQKKSAGQAEGEKDIDFVNPPREGKLESTRLRESLRKQVEEAIESLGCRVTVGDVAARAGVSVTDAEEALNALAADCLGSIQVSDTGDVLYVFPSNFVSVIRGRSWMLRIAPFITGVKDTAAYLVRVSFGAALVASVALVWVTIIAIMSSSSSDRDDRNRGGGSYYNGGGYYARRNSMVWVDASDLLWFQSRRQPPRYEHAPDQPMSFLESIFSFVFGDGDPNRNFEEMRWKTVGRYIQSKGGVVTAEELAPFLDPPEKSNDDEIDESYVVPALVRFGGSPEVDDNGNLLYRFESLQRLGGASASAQSPTEPAALQNLWEQTKATGGQRTGAIALGLANLVGVGVLGGFLRQPDIFYSLAQSSLGFVINLMPLLQVYAASFFVIPALRWLLNQQRNLSLQTANRIRLDRLRELREPEPALQRKLLSAQQQAKTTVIRDKDIVYRSDRNLDDQKDLAEEDFDRRLRELDQPSGGPFSDWVPQTQEVDADAEWRQRRR